VLLPTVAVGIVAALVALSGHQGDTALVVSEQARQRQEVLSPIQLEAILQNTREPVPAGVGRPAVAVSCRSGTRGPKLNPWRCAIHYRSGDTIDYRIVVGPDGAFHGTDRTGARLIHGCCLLGVGQPSHRPA
jgi:hypothetical protein